MWAICGTVVRTIGATRDRSRVRLSAVHGLQHWPCHHSLERPLPSDTEEAIWRFCVTGEHYTVRDQATAVACWTLFLRCDVRQGLGGAVQMLCARLQPFLSNEEFPSASTARERLLFKG